MQRAVVILLDHAVAGVFSAAIDAQNSHCRECSRRKSTISGAGVTTRGTTEMSPMYAV